MTNTKAALTHLAISVVIFLIVLAITIFIWYPTFYFFASDTKIPLLTMTFVDIGLGPLLTFVVYKEGKKLLKLDLSIIIIMQILALIWGTWVLHSQRPVLIVHDDGMLYCLNQEASQLAEADLTQFNNTEEIIPQAFLPQAKTRQEFERRKEIMNNLASNDKRSPLPAFIFGKAFEPINSNNLNAILQGEWEVDAVASNHETYKAAWAQFKQKYQPLENYAFFPLTCSSVEYFAVVDKHTGSIVDGLPFSFIHFDRKKH